MPKTWLVVCAALIALPAFGQSQPSDADVIVVYKLCEPHLHVVKIGPDVDIVPKIVVDSGWEKCLQINEEYQKRQLPQQQQDQKAKDQIDNVLKGLGE